MKISHIIQGHKELKNYECLPLWIKKQLIMYDGKRKTCQLLEREKKKSYEIVWFVFLLKFL